jgi:hypothetical protein
MYVTVGGVQNGDLLTTYTLTTCDYILQITDTHSILQFPLAVSWQRILTEYNSLTELHTPNITHEVFSSQSTLPTNSFLHSSQYRTELSDHFISCL